MKMTKKFTDRLEEYLSSECSDYGLSYTWEWDESYERCEVTINSDRSDVSSIVYFQYDDVDDNLYIELTEDSYEMTREFDQTVKYFWMKIAPDVFAN